MQKLIKLLAIIIPVVIVACLNTGCTHVKESGFMKPKSVATVYFHRGVYKSSDNDYFYIFYDENSGYTADNEEGIGLPFSCVQTDNTVKFKFGGSEEPEEILKIQSVKDQVITGYFPDNQSLTFILIPNANPDNFDAIEYTKNEKK